MRKPAGYVEGDTGMTSTAVVTTTLSTEGNNTVFPGKEINQDNKLHAHINDTVYFALCCMFCFYFSAHSCAQHHFVLMTRLISNVQLITQLQGTLP